MRAWIVLSAVLGGFFSGLQRADAAPDDPPSPAAVLEAYGAIEHAVRSGEIDAAEFAGLDDPTLARLGGVHVQVRLHGELLARSTESALVPPDLEEARAMLERAAADALIQVEARLPLTNDLQRGERRAELGLQLMVSVEVCGAWTPLRADTWEDTEAALAPGLDAVGVRAALDDGGPAGMPEVMLPTQMMLSNQLPHRVLAGLVARALGDGGAARSLASPRELREHDGVQVLRARTIHLAQTTLSAPPEFLIRGARPVGINSINAGALTMMGQDLAAHLAVRISLAGARAVPGSLYEPWSGAAQQTENDAGAFWLALLALRAHARAAGNAALLETVHTACDRFNADERAAESLAGQPAASLLALHVCAPVVEQPAKAGGKIDDGPTDLGLNAALEELRRWAAKQPKVDASENPLPKFTEKEGGVAANALAAYVYVHHRSTLVPALLSARGAVAVTPLECDALVDGFLRRVLVETPEARRVGLLPWIGWAELAMLEARRRATQREALEVPSAASLRQLRRIIWEHQLSVLDAGPENADLAGGIAFTARSRANTPLPTWQTARPLAFLASMAAAPELTDPEERAGELARVLSGVRFLRQLQVDDSAGWLYPDLASARGGIRASAWDQQMPLEASALALLTVTETLNAVRRMAAPEAAPTPSP